MKNFDEKIITKNQNQNGDKKIDKYIEKNLIKIKKLYLTELNQYYSHVSFFFNNYMILNN